MLKTNFLWLLLIILMPLAQAESDATSTEVCKVNSSDNFNSFLSSLSRIENHLMQMAWKYEKYRETIYHPLWDARQLLKNQNNPKLAADAQTRIERYENIAQGYLEEAEDHYIELEQNFDLIVSELASLQIHCPLKQFRDCLTSWGERTQADALELKKQIGIFHQQNQSLNQEVLSSSEDTPTAHDPYSERVFPRHEIWLKDFYPQFHELLRALQEDFEYQWPLENCCQVCSEENLKKSEEFKFNQVRGNELLP